MSRKLNHEAVRWQMMYDDFLLNIHVAQCSGDYSMEYAFAAQESDASSDSRSEIAKVNNYPFEKFRGHLS
jgi:hypothetical protein